MSKEYFLIWLLLTVACTVGSYRIGALLGDAVTRRRVSTWTRQHMYLSRRTTRAQKIGAWIRKYTP
jgi:hypothetical protein